MARLYFKVEQNNCIIKLYTKHKDNKNKRENYTSLNFEIDFVEIIKLIEAPLK